MLGGNNYMLKLSNIKKEYITGDTKVHALRGVNIEFRENELVSILGQSGCGKTTLLNIIGGLDQYTSGDLIINGKSTKKFKDSDWDTYRNHSIGFVFQSYNLISHQTVLANVELAMTLSGVSKQERRQRAIDALEKVGLGDQLNKRPNQMSGGQMQRVAIARALVNNPDIILADEPTGALDTKTSIQIMNILKEIAKERLVIMVTHNPSLAEEYSTRIIKLLDGEVIDDSMPYDKNSEAVVNYENKKKKSMSFTTALSLSLNNLMTKKGRTFLTAFAGSIGIIGIALILSLSNGVQNYIDSVEEETLGSYPLQIERESADLTGFMTNMMESQTKQNEAESGDNEIISNNMMSSMISSMAAGTTTNDLKDFKEYLETNSDTLSQYTSGIEYQYKTQLNLYKADDSEDLIQVNPSQVMDSMGVSMGNMAEIAPMSPMGGTNYDIWSQLPAEKNLLDTQYELVDGRFPESHDEVVLITDGNGTISDYALYALGLLDQTELKDMLKSAMNGEELEAKEIIKYSYDDLMNLKFKLLLNTDYYEKDENGTWKDMSDNEDYILNKLQDALEVKVVGIIKQKSGTSSSSVAAYGGVGYSTDLTKYAVETIQESEIVKEQMADPNTDILTGIAFETENKDEDMTMEDLQAYIATRPEAEQQQMQGAIQQMKAQGATDEMVLDQFKDYLKALKTDATYEENLELLGVAHMDEPSTILIYPSDFEAKEKIADFIDEYNSGRDENEALRYTDFVALMMSSVTTIINAITYILVGFVAISLVVSCIMIGIITYISVLERTKEIGILRAIGASKKDISRVFNAETFIIGLCAGLLGIGVTVLLDIPINNIVYNAFGIENIASLPVNAAIILVVISMVLTVISGLIPSKMAAKKDPVEALRTE